MVEGDIVESSSFGGGVDLRSRTISLAGCMVACSEYPDDDIVS